MAEWWGQGTAELGVSVYSAGLKASPGRATGNRQASASKVCRTVGRERPFLGGPAAGRGVVRESLHLCLPPCLPSSLLAYNPRAPETGMPLAWSQQPAPGDSDSRSVGLLRVFAGRWGTPSKCYPQQQSSRGRPGSGLVTSQGLHTVSCSHYSPFLLPSFSVGGDSQQASRQKVPPGGDLLILIPLFSRPPPSVQPHWVPEDRKNRLSWWVA